MPRSSLKPALGLALTALLCLSIGLGGPALAQYDGQTPSEVAATEDEALAEALDALGLAPDSPELADLDNGERWGLVERPNMTLRSRRQRSGWILI